jgi:hypothetical protein
MCATASTMLVFRWTLKYIFNRLIKPLRIVIYYYSRLLFGEFHANFSYHSKQS